MAPDTDTDTDSDTDTDPGPEPALLRCRQSGAWATGGGLGAMARQDGTSYFAGGYRAPFVLGEHAASEPDGLDAYVADYSLIDKTSATASWLRTFGSAGMDYFSAVVPGDGSVTAVGASAGVIDAGAGPVTSGGGTEAFVVVLGATDGSHIASVGLGPTDGTPIARADSTGDAVFVVWTTAYTRLNVARIGGGEVTWRRSYDATSVGNPSLATGPDGGVVFGTGFQGPVDFGGGALTGVGDGDGALVHLDAEGNHVWSRRIAKLYSVGRMAATPDGGLVLFGDFSTRVDLGGGPIVAPGEGYSSFFLARLDGDGQQVWGTAFGTGGDPSWSNWAWDVAVADDGTIAVSGRYARLQLAGGSEKVNGSFVATFDGDGGVLAARHYPRAGDPQWFHSVAWDGEDVHVAGVASYLRGAEGLDLGCGVMDGSRDAESGLEYAFVLGVD